MFKNKKILVAGGDGLIGRQLVGLLKDEGAHVKVVDKKTNPDMDLIKILEPLKVKGFLAQFTIP